MLKDKAKTCGQCSHWKQTSLSTDRGECTAPVPQWAFITCTITSDDWLENRTSPDAASCDCFTPLPREKEAIPRTYDVVEEVIQALKQLIAPLTDDQVLEVFSRWCRHCGKERRAGEPPCQCWNNV